VFMAVMGYFVAKGNKSLRTNILQGLKLILWGLLLNIGMNTHLFVKIILGQIQLSPWPYIFGVDILFLAGLSIILIAVVQKLFQKKWGLWVLLMVLIGFANEYIPVYDGDYKWFAYIQAYFNGYYYWSYFPLFPWAAYPIAGYAFYLIEKKYQLKQWAEKWLIVIGVLLLIGILLTFEFGFSNTIFLQAYYHHDGWVMIWELAFVLFWVLLVKLLLGEHSGGNVIKYLRWIGKNVTAFYVFQWLLVGNFATSFYKTQYPLQLIFWLIFVLALSTLLVFLWTKIKRKAKNELWFSKKKQHLIEEDQIN
ncbi:MAG: heparan-alpha-glucosaminide N-acetyltransferase domain-containing protein, partial [Ignavibacteria bacterium]|nr:heparan-alpha-glucosaminide N-acetyltransferase domain-containing protein [Ignavibacteria bacterium]